MCGKMLTLAIMLVVVAMAEDPCSVLDVQMANFLQRAGSFVIQKDGTVETVKPAQLMNADEFKFSGGYKTEQGLFGVQGDIIRPLQVPILQGSTSQSTQGQLWPDGIVPFVISSDLSGISMDRLFKAMRHVSNSSCVTFEPFDQNRHVNHRAVLTVQGGPICASFIGYHPSQDVQQTFHQHLIISDLCPFGSVLHELMHTLGFHHEDQRRDRHNNLQQKIETEGEPGQADGAFKEYDHLSIMHDTSFGTSLDPLRQFMVGQRIALSPMDKRALNFAYNCASKCGGRMDCANHGYVGSDCRCVCPDGFEGDRCEKLTGVHASMEKMPQTGDYPGSNRKIVSPGESTPDKPVLMLYEHHQPSVEYQVGKDSALQAAIFVYNPNVKISVDLSAPEHLESIHKVVIPKEQQETRPVDEDWLTKTLAMPLPAGQTGLTLWADKDSFALDRLHPVYSVSPQVANISQKRIMSCHFDGDQIESTCPVQSISVWRHSADKSYMFIDQTMFDSDNKNSASLVLGPIDAYTGVPSCLAFDYRLQGHGVGGLATYYIAKGNDRRQGSVIGWRNTGSDWQTQVQDLSNVFYDKSALKGIVIEFTVLPGWDQQSSISIDNVYVDECQNFRSNKAPQSST